MNDECRIMNVRYGVRSFLAAIALALAFSSTASAQIMDKPPSGPRIEPVVVYGSVLKAAYGKKIPNLGLYADKGDGLKPIPFQIDERDMRKHLFKERLEYVFTGGDTSPIDSDPKFDADDELVFMAFDGGAKVQEENWPGNALSGIEIKIFEHDSDVKSYVYLFSFGEPPVRSSKRYVFYDHVKDTVYASDYTLGYDGKRKLLPTRLAISPEAGGSGKNMIDGIKLRNEVALSNGFLVYTLDETDYPHKAKGYINGPVRVIRQLSGNHTLFWGVYRKIQADSIFWSNGFTLEVPTIAPIRRHMLSHFTTKLYVDILKSAKGMKFYSDKNPEAVNFNGSMDDAEKDLDYSLPEWIVTAGESGALFQKPYLDGLSGVDADLFYMDSGELKDVPESETGVQGAGYTIRHREKADEKKSTITLGFFVLDTPYSPGKEEPAIKAFDDPLYVKTKDGEVQNMFAARLERHVPPVSRKQPPIPSYKEEGEAKKKRKYGLIPMIIASSDKGFGGGLMFVYRDLFAPGITASNVTFFTTKDYFIAALALMKDKPGPNENWAWRIAMLAANRPSRFFYGIGNDTDKDDDISDFADSTQLVALWGARRMGHSNFWASTLLRMKHTEIDEGIGVTGIDSVPTQNRYPGLFGLEGGYTNAYRVSFFHDDRDNKFRPTSGGYREVAFWGIEDGFGNDFEYHRYYLDLRQFFAVKSDKDILAFRLQANKIDGNPPFYELSVVGSEFTVRGFFEGRYRDNDSVTVNTEWRHRLWKIMESNLFFDFGRVYNKIEEDFDFKSYRTAYGFGSRLTIPPSIVMRMDIGFSVEGTVFYLNFGHTF